MLDSKLSINRRLVFALDFSTALEAAKFVRLLNGIVGCFKVGLKLFVNEGPNALEAISDNSNAGIFLDLKLHDIPATVRGALQSASCHGAEYLTVHCEPGEPILKSDSETLGLGLSLLGITVLTSVGEKELLHMGIDRKLSLNDLVLLRAQIAKRAGCKGVVCSGREVGAVRQNCGDDFLLVTPGIRPEWSGVSQDDQTRTTTPKQAIASGADLIVVGRPISTAADPKSAAQRIIEEIEHGLKER